MVVGGLLASRSYWRVKRAVGAPASEASLPPEASQVVAEGDGLRVFYNFLQGNIFFSLVFMQNAKFSSHFPTFTLSLTFAYALRKRKCTSVKLASKWLQTSPWKSSQVDRRVCSITPQADKIRVVRKTGEIALLKSNQEAEDQKVKIFTFTFNKIAKSISCSNFNLRVKIQW